MDLSSSSYTEVISNGIMFTANNNVCLTVCSFGFNMYVHNSTATLIRTLYIHTKQQNKRKHSKMPFIF